MADAFSLSGAAPQLVAARLFAQATAQGTALLTEVNAAGEVPPRADESTTPRSAQPQAPTAAGAAPAVPDVRAPAFPAASTSQAPALALPSNSPAAPAAAKSQSVTQVAVANIATPLQPPAADPVRAETSPAPAALVTLSPAGRAALPAPPPSAPITGSTAPPPVLVEAVTAERAVAVLRQASPAPLLADLRSAVDQGALPPTVRSAAQTVLSAAPQIADLASAVPLKDAVRGSGLFLESNLATSTAPGVQTPPAQDLKAALLVLAGRLREWAGDSRLAAPDRPAAEGRAEEPTPPAILRDALPPAPPIRGRTAMPQPPATPTLPPEATPEVVRDVLLHRTEAALARQSLMQAASSRVARAALGPAETADSPAWLFEIPVTTPQGPAALPFQISRDGGSGGAATGPGPVTWRVAFALDLEPVGAVNVRAALTGPEASITLRVERPEIAAALSARLQDLTDSLAVQGLTARVGVLSGAPATASGPAPGEFYSRAP